MFKQIDYVIIGVSNMEQSVSFYKDALGMSLKFNSPEWTEFVTGPTTLALHPARPRVASATATTEMVAGTSSLGFNVTDLDKTVRELKARNIRFVMEPKAREGEGIRLAVFVDPDGLEISIAEPLKQSITTEAPGP